MKKKVAVIGAELRAHAPFTFLGALSGIVCMVLFKGLEYRTSHTIFYLFHPAHVLLSALVTAFGPGGVCIKTSRIRFMTIIA